MRREKREAILGVLQLENRPLGPAEIAFRTGLNHSTTRNYVRILLRSGCLRQPYRGAYVADPTYGVDGPLVGSRSSEEPPRVHNLRLRWKVPKSWITQSLKEILEEGPCRITLSIGVKRSLVTGIIAADDHPLDLVAVSMAVDLWRLKVENRLGHAVDLQHVNVSSVELGWDYDSIRLDGLKCVTDQSFLGNLERIYNRDLGLRSEVKVENTNLESLYTLLKGGVTAYNVLQGTFAVQREISRMNEILRAQGDTFRRLERLFSALLDYFDRSRNR